MKGQIDLIGKRNRLHDRSKSTQLVTVSNVNKATPYNVSVITKYVDNDTVKLGRETRTKGKDRYNLYIVAISRLLNIADCRCVFPQGNL